MALVLNLAIYLANSFGRRVTLELAATAKEAKKAIRMVNAPIVDLKVDAALVGYGRKAYDWRSDR